MNIETSRCGRGITYMLLCAAMWSTAGVLIQQIPWNPLAIAGGRSLLAAGCLWVYMKQTHCRFRLNRQSVLGGLVLCVTFLLFLTANKMTTAANAIVLQFTAPVFILAYSGVWEKNKLRSSDLLVVLGVMVGVSMFFLEQLTPGGVIGNLAGILSGAAFGGGFFIIGRSDQDSRMSAILLGHLVTAIVGLPFLFLGQNQFTWTSWLFLLLLGIFQLGIPYVLYGLALRDCPPLMSCLLSALEPLLNPLWVFLASGQRPGGFALVGGLLVICAVTLWTAGSLRSPRQSSTG